MTYIFMKDLDDPSYLLAYRAWKSALSKKKRERLRRVYEEEIARLILDSKEKRYERHIKKLGDS